MRKPRIEVLLHGDRPGFLYLELVVNGMQSGCTVYTKTMKQAKSLSAELKILTENIYETAFTEGYDACQAEIRHCLGVKHD